MKVLWIGKRPLTKSGESGEEVFDRKMIAACRQLGYNIDLFHPEPVSRINEVCNMVLGLPYQRARFATNANVRNLRETARHYDTAICSWEPFDGLARSLPTPTILIVHNISSQALPALFPRNPLATLSSMRARLWEQSCYRDGSFAAVAALSRPDFAYLHQIGAPRPILLPPGMPPSTPISPDAEFRGDVVVSGSFGWPPKRRDIMRFAREYQKEPQWPVFSDDLPPDAHKLIQPFSPDQDNSASIRCGLITDRFEAGHKLKTLAYIANNQIVLSFADVSFDFAHVPDHAFFIRKIETISDVQRHINMIESVPITQLRDRFARFKQACIAMFTWQASAETLMNAASRFVRPTISAVA